MTSDLDPAAAEAGRSALALLIERQGWSNSILAEVEPMLERRHAGAVDLVHPGLNLPFHPHLYDQELADAGLLSIGTCPNGDMVVIDCCEEALPVRYISHEEFDYDDVSRAALLGISRQIAGSIGRFLARADRGEIPRDFFDGSWPGV